MKNVVIPDEIKKYLKGKYLIEENKNLISIKEEKTNNPLFEIIDLEEISRLIVLTESHAHYAEHVTVILFEDLGVPALHIINGELKLLVCAS